MAHIDKVKEEKFIRLEFGGALDVVLFLVIVDNHVVVPHQQYPENADDDRTPRARQRTTE